MWFYAQSLRWLDADGQGALGLGFVLSDYRYECEGNSWCWVEIKTKFNWVSAYLPCIFCNLNSRSCPSCWCPQLLAANTRDYLRLRGSCIQRPPLLLTPNILTPDYKTRNSAEIGMAFPRKMSSD